MSAIHENTNVSPAAVVESFEVPERAQYGPGVHDVKPVGELLVSQLRSAAALAKKRKSADAAVLAQLAAMVDEAGQPGDLPISAILRFQDHSVPFCHGWIAGPRATRGPQP